MAKDHLAFSISSVKVASWRAPSFRDAERYDVPSKLWRSLDPRTMYIKMCLLVQRFNFFSQFQMRLYNRLPIAKIDIVLPSDNYER